MNLDFNSNAPKNSIAPNVYADEMVIVKATDSSNEVTPWNEKYDVSITIEGRVDGLEYPITHTIKGNFRMTNDVITGWGGAFVVRDFIIASGYLDGKDELFRKEVSNILQSGKIPESFLKYLIGRKFWKASYAAGTKEDGKTKYRTFNKLAPSLEALKSEWEASRKNGYPADYTPNPEFYNDNSSSDLDESEPETI